MFVLLTSQKNTKIYYNYKKYFKKYCKKSMPYYAEIYNSNFFESIYMDLFNKVILSIVCKKSSHGSAGI